MYVFKYKLNLNFTLYGQISLIWCSVGDIIIAELLLNKLSHLCNLNYDGLRTGNTANSYNTRYFI